jgi:citrate synthase
VTLFELLGRLAATSQPSQGRDAGKIHLDAATVVRAVMRAVSGVPARPREPLHAQLARGWGAVRAAEPIRRALVLLADHELNASTFAARVTASSGASLAACVLSGLCALSGPLHGCAGLAVSSMARSVGADGSLMLRRRIAEGEQIPGFGHPLYPGADPRCAALLESFATPPAHRRLRDVVARELGLEPNVDFALSAMSAAFGMDQKAPFLIFATARCVGWIAHSLEQRSEGGLIRPRARYVGALP